MIRFLLQQARLTVPPAPAPGRVLMPGNPALCGDYPQRNAGIQTQGQDGFVKYGTRLRQCPCEWGHWWQGCRGDAWVGGWVKTLLRQDGAPVGAIA